jgi:hypothetical protein
MLKDEIKKKSIKNDLKKQLELISQVRNLSHKTKIISWKANWLKKNQLKKI